MTRAGLNGRFDLDAAAAAAAAEADAVPFAFTYKGQPYEVPPAVKWPLQAQRLLGQGELEAALVLLIGEPQVEALAAAGITVGELNLLFTAIGEAAGLGGLPNSSVPARPGSRQT